MNPTLPRGGDPMPRGDAPLGESPLLALFDRVCCESPTPAMTDELQQALRSQPGAPEMYLEYLAMHADLFGVVRLERVRRLVRTEIGVPDNEAEASIPPGPLSRGWYLPLLALAAALLLALVPFSQGPAGQVAQEAGAPATMAALPEAVARISQVDITDWPGAGPSFFVGDTLMVDQSVRFAAGLVEIEFQQGAVVVIEGPADFTVTSANSGKLDEGRLAAVAPPWADGFRIDTPNLNVIDRGTEFAVAVDGEHNVDVTVVKGMVEVVTPALPAHNGIPRATMLTTGATVRADAEGFESVDVQDPLLVELTSRLPAKPDGTEVEVVGQYQHDFLPGEPGKPCRDGAWRYYTNTTGPIGRPEHYQELLWDPVGEGCYDANGIDPKDAAPPLSVVKLRRGTGHPGWGSRQASDGIDRYAIAAFTVPEEGSYRLESGWIFRPENKPLDAGRPWRQHQAVDVYVHVDDAPPAITAEVVRDRFVRFEGSLGQLPAGATVYVGVGPRCENFSDRFEWGFAIVRGLDPHHKKGT